MSLKIFGRGDRPENINDELIRALRSQKEGELLPDDGVFSSIYQQLNGPSISLMISTGKESEYIYIDNDEFIGLVKDIQPEWMIGADRNLVRLMMNYNINNSRLVISFVFNLEDDSGRNALYLIKKNKTFSLNYLNMLYGGLVLEARVKYRLPDSIISGMKKL